MLEFIPLHHVILRNALLCSYELNTRDACWIAVDVWSNSSRCRIALVYLSRTWCLYTWSCLDILITMHFSINCSTVICSPTVEFAILREATSENYGPGSIFHHINFPLISYFCRRLFCNLYFPIYVIKIPKIFILLSLSDLTFANGHEGIDNPFIALVARFLFVCAGTRDLRVVSYWIDTLILKNWGKYLCYFAASPFPVQGKTNTCSRGSKVKEICPRANNKVMEIDMMRKRPGGHRFH